MSIESCKQLHSKMADRQTEKETTKTPVKKLDCIESQTCESFILDKNENESFLSQSLEYLISQSQDINGKTLHENVFIFFLDEKFLHKTTDVTKAWQERMDVFL